jgi:hypothetical protein
MEPTFGFEGGVVVQVGEAAQTGELPEAAGFEEVEVLFLRLHLVHVVEEDAPRPEGTRRRRLEDAAPQFLPPVSKGARLQVRTDAAAAEDVAEASLEVVSRIKQLQDGESVKRYRSVVNLERVGLHGWPTSTG